MERGVHFQNETSYSGKGGDFCLDGEVQKSSWSEGTWKRGRPHAHRIKWNFFLKIASTLLEYNEFKRINQLLFQLKSMILGEIKVN